MVNFIKGLTRASHLPQDVRLSPRQGLHMATLTNYPSRQMEATSPTFIVSSDSRHPFRSPLKSSGITCVVKGRRPKVNSTRCEMGMGFSPSCPHVYTCGDQAYAHQLGLTRQTVRPVMPCPSLLGFNLGHMISRLALGAAVQACIWASRLRRLNVLPFSLSILSLNSPPEH